ncbi:MAG: NAD(P)H-dependent oxidoreductase subunit E [Deltaproteobacteria bacterium]|nr:NAD(P)H-dependent oxidoreductase subunit E [Deltaproteobacteria bacterium]
MDLHPIKTLPSPAETAAVDAVLGSLDAPREAPVGLQVSQQRRHLLLPALHAVQRGLGWISPGALGYISERLRIPPAEAYGVASFYALFALEPRAPVVAHVCDDIVCKARGADAITLALDQRLGPAGTANDGATWLRSPCLGLCDRAPAALLTVAGATPAEHAFGGASAGASAGAIAGAIAAALVRRQVPEPPRTVIAQPRESLRILRRVGAVDPARLDDYRAHGGYQALRRALELGPSAIIREVTDAKLVGRGGAAFPTGRKWAAVASQPVRPHYLVCNADESEPGTFKDRVLMEEDPFALIEAMTIAGYATGAEHGFLYVRGEYPLAIDRLQHAIQAARDRGYLGEDVMGRGARFDLEIRRGAGAYICGEETALFNSIEGFRGEPRNKPPFPVEVGLFGKPTVINNVETLVNVLDIVLEGGASFAARGTPGSAGTKLFCLSGHVERPGLYEVPLGARLSELIALAGGVIGGRRIKAVLLGGAAGSFLTERELDVPLTFEDTRKIGATLGSGVVLVLDEHTDLLALVRRMAEFFRDESCGQCVPCRVGTVRVEEILGRVARGAPNGTWADERALLGELGQAMRDASICGLGQTATIAVESAVAKLGILPADPKRGTP